MRAVALAGKAIGKTLGEGVKIPLVGQVWVLAHRPGRPGGVVLLVHVRISVEFDAPGGLAREGDPRAMHAVRLAATVDILPGNERAGRRKRRQGGFDRQGVLRGRRFR